MSKKSKAVADYLGQEFVITREFDAPRQLVFKAWTDANHLSQWWGPRGFTNPVCDWNPRPGKAIHVVMRAPNGTDFAMGGEFREIVAPERLVFTSGALDETGAMLFEFLHTVTFMEQKGKTLLKIQSRVTQTTPGAGKYIGGFEAGMTQSLERLSGHISNKPGPLVIERTLNAPIAQVWKAMTDNEALKQWFFELSEFKPEAGFQFEFAAEKDGFKYVHQCEISEVIPAEKLAYSWRYAGHEGNSLVTFELTSEGENTKVKLTHTGLETFPHTPNFARTNFIQGWTMIIGQGLKPFVESENMRDREIVISRELDAPQELVWQAMTDPNRVIHWWGPQGFTTTIQKMEVRPGGVWKLIMHGPDGIDYPNESIFKEIVKPERIVYSHSGGKAGVPSADFVMTWTFEALAENRTKLTMRSVFPSAEARDRIVKVYGAIEGGKQTLERLSEYLPKMA